MLSLLCPQGFCLPEELSDEVGDDTDGQFNTTEGGGLADGQGAKDVSNQVRAALALPQPCAMICWF